MQGCFQTRAEDSAYAISWPIVFHRKRVWQHDDISPAGAEDSGSCRGHLQLCLECCTDFLHRWSLDFIQRAWHEPQEEWNRHRFLSACRWFAGFLCQLAGGCVFSVGGFGGMFLRLWLGRLEPPAALRFRASKYDGNGVEEATPYVAGPLCCLFLIVVQWLHSHHQLDRLSSLESETPNAFSAHVTFLTRKVEELSERGITANLLLCFYRKLGCELMPHFCPAIHTTNDVVRQAIIPATRKQRCAYTQLIDQSLPDKMVTHTWQNHFSDLVAAVLADAVNENSFDLVKSMLENDVVVLERMLQQQGAGNRSYWICAFSVNQHAGICGGNPNRDCDSLTGRVHETCDCGLPKFFNSTPPVCDKGSIECEMNKFHDMMAFLAKDPHFSQVVAVDSAFALFNRAWCVAELVQADRTRLKQVLKVHCRDVLQRRLRLGNLQKLQVEKMQAAREEDVDYILSGIPDKNQFNQKLRHLIFDQSGLLSTFCQRDSARQMEEVGNLLKWGLADEGEGRVWPLWTRVD